MSAKFRYCYIACAIFTRHIDNSASCSRLRLVWGSLTFAQYVQADNKIMSRHLSDDRPIYHCPRNVRIRENGSDYCRAAEKQERELVCPLFTGSVCSHFVAMQKCGIQTVSCTKGVSTPLNNILSLSFSRTTESSLWVEHFRAGQMEKTLANSSRTYLIMSYIPIGHSHLQSLAVKHVWHVLDWEACGTYEVTTGRTEEPLYVSHARDAITINTYSFPPSKRRKQYHSMPGTSRHKNRNYSGRPPAPHLCLLDVTVQIILHNCIKDWRWDSNCL